MHQACAARSVAPIRLLVYLVAFLLLASARPAVAQTGTITGTVTAAATSSPIPSVEIYVYNASNSVVAYGMTNATGTYTVSGLSAGTYRLRTAVSESHNFLDQIYSGIACTVGSCAIVSGTPVTVVAGGITSGINFPLAGGGAISGRLTDAVTLAGIGTNYVNACTADGSCIRDAATSADGTYQIVGLPAGTYYVRTAVWQNYVDELYDNIPCSPGCTLSTGAPVPVVVGGVTPNVNFALTTGGTISGSVRSASTLEALSGVMVFAYTATGGIAGIAQTGSNGTFSIDALAPGTYYARASGLAGYLAELYEEKSCLGCSVTEGTPISVAAGTVTPNINFTLGLSGSITGRVSNDATGAGLAGVGVSVYSTGGVKLGTVQTSASGVYTFGSMAAGTYYLRTEAGTPYVNEVFDNLLCAAGCHPTLGTPVTVSAGATTPGIDLALSIGATLSGVVRDATTLSGINGVSVQVYTSGLTLVKSGTTDSMGAYSLAGLYPDTYYLRTSVGTSSAYIDELYGGALCNGACYVLSGVPLTVASGSVVPGLDFDLTAGGSIAGTVIDAMTGLPVASTTVTVYNAAGTFVGSASTNVSGVFSVSRLPTGSYFARTTSTGYLDELYNDIPCPLSACVAATGQPLAVVAGATTAGVDFALSPGGAISGSVSDAVSGLPLALVSVSAYNAVGTLVRSVNSAAGGTFTIGGLPTGIYYLRTTVRSNQNYIDEMYDDLPCVNCSVLTSTPVAVTAPSTIPGIVFALSGGGSISGWVRDAATQVALSASVSLYTQRGDLFKTASTVSGVYTFTGVPAGTYYVAASSSGHTREQYDGIPCSLCGQGGTPVTVVVGSTTTDINFLLDAVTDSGGSTTGGITGVIIDAVTSAPLSLVSVSGVRPDGSANNFGMTSDTGVYTANGVAAGTYYVKASAGNANYIDEVYDDIACDGCDARVGTPVVVTAGAVSQGVDLALSAGGAISGVVTDASTLASIPGVGVQVINAGGGIGRTVTTGADGRFFITGLQAGDHYLRTAFSSTSPYPVWVYGSECPLTCAATSGTPIPVTVGTTTTGINIQLSRGGIIGGTVTEQGTTTGIAGATVTLYSASGLSQRSATTAANGDYAFVGLAPATYYIGASVTGAHNYVDQLFSGIPCVPSCPDGILSGSPVVVSAGQTATANVALQPGGSVRGTVRDFATAAGLGAVTVTVYSGSGVSVRSGTTNSSGVYVVKGLPTGSYYLKTTTPASLNYGDQLFDGVSCAACDPLGGTAVPVTVGVVSDNIDFNLTGGGTISGRVIDATTGAGLAASVQISDAFGRLVRSAQASASGEYEVKGLPSGSYRAKVLAAAHVDQVYSGATCVGPCSAADGTPIAVIAGAVTAHVNFALSADGSISGSIVARTTGLPVSASIRVYNAQGSVVKTVSDSGPYSVNGLSPGTYYLLATRSIIVPAYADQVYDDITCSVCDVTLGTPVVVSAGMDTPGIDFSLDSGGSLSGTVKSAESLTGLRTVGVNIHAADGGVVATATTGEAGTYSMSGLAPGIYYARTNLGAASHYVDELFSETTCIGCDPMLGTPIVITAGNNTPNINFTLDATGGAINGVVREQGSNTPLATVAVTVYSANGGVVRTATTGVAGAYSVAGLPAGTYYARTEASRGWVNRVYSDAGVPCMSDCDVLAGTPIVVVNGLATNGIDFSLPVNLARNLGFGAGTANWSLFATPSNSYLTSAIVNGVFEFTRVAPPPGTSNQAVVFQTTGVAESAGTPLVAAFDLGNSSTVRKRISVLILDSNFGDLSVCTFWLPPSQPLTTYRMKTHTTKAWTNASIYFYAATPGTNGGSYRLDNVAFYADAGESATQTRCEDPNAEALPGGVTSSTMLQNGDFGSGTLAPGWGTFGTITTQVSSGVLEFIRPTSVAPVGVVLQPTGQGLSAGQIVTAGFALGNSSSVRKRVTVILHDNSFADLSACTFWLPPGQPLAGYSMKTYATQTWTNATLSVYPASTGLEQWMRLDDVSLVREAGTAIAGTECVEPGSARADGPAEAGTIGSQDVPGSPAEAGHYDRHDDRHDDRPGDRHDDRRDDDSRHDGWTLRDNGALVAVASDAGDAVLELREPIDLTGTTAASLEFLSRLDADASTADVEVRTADGAWGRLAHVAPGTLEWRSVDLSDFAGEVIEVRFVFHAAAGEPADTWELSDVRVVR